MTYTILVIDDHDLFRRMVGQTLEQAGYHVQEAPEGKTALRMLRGTPADLVVTDLIMPEQEGLETIRILHRDFPAIPVIAISGGLKGGTIDFLPVAKALGAQRVFNKPLDRQAFLQAIQELLTKDRQ